MMRSMVLSVPIVLCALFLAGGEAAAVKPGRKLTWPGGGEGEVSFDGTAHAEKFLRCKDCHPGIFTMIRGAAKMTMAELDSGRYCGACHNSYAAFGTQDKGSCRKCHKGK